jgi:HSP20 family protein
MASQTVQAAFPGISIAAFGFSVMALPKETHMASGPLAPFGWGGQGNDPFTMLRHEMESLFDNVMRGGALQPAGGAANVLAPRMDISEDDNEIRLSAEMPGVSPENVSVELNDDLLTIRGEREAERQEERKNFHVMERTYGAFQRSLRLPFPVDPAQVQARVDHGVLTVTIPKTGIKQRSQRIEVKSGGGGGEVTPEGGKGKPGRGTHH